MPPIGVITAAVPHAPASLNSPKLFTKTSLSSVFKPRYSLATCSSEYLVILGKIEGDFGVTKHHFVLCQRSLLHQLLQF